MTTATLSRRLIRPMATRPARRSMLVGFGATLAIGLLVLVGASVGVAVSAGSTVLKGVNVAGVELTGLDRAAAAARLEDGLPALDTGAAVVSVGDTEIPVAYADLGRGYETDAMLDTAFSVGRSGNPLADAVDRLRSLIHPTTLPVVVHAYDADALASIAGDVATEISHPPREAAVLRDGAAFSVRESAEGRGIAGTDVAAALGAAVDNADPADVRVELTAATLPPVVDTATAEAAAEAASAMASRLKVTIPGAAEGESLVLRPATIAAAISFGPEGAAAYTARIDDAAVTAAVEALAGDIDQAPVNAQIAVAAGGGLGGVIAGQDGRRLNVADSSEGVLDALARRAGGASVGSLALVVDVTEPALTTAEAEAILPQMQMVSTWTTHYVPGDGNGFGNNINIPAFDIDGRNLAPGEWFSFWDSIGPVTEERGFMYGGVIIGGRSVAGGAIGGGICSTSTTIFNAALRMGLEMGIRANHYYYIDRYPDGLDATVYMDDNFVQDMTFRNDTEHPIVIRGFGGSGFVTFQIWSVPTGRSVVITDPVTSNHRSATETTVVDPGMAPGTSKRVEFPHDGHDVSRTRFVYDADGNLLHQNTYFSSYRTVNGITAVGPRAAAPPDEGDGGTAGDGEGDGSGDVPPDEDA
jgi:vancomycin resistance protein YoaR